MCRTLNSDIVTHCNNLSAQLSTHDVDIKSLLNNKGCVKSVQRIVKTRFKLESGAIDDDYECSLSIPISPINLSKSILLVNNCVFRPHLSSVYSSNYDYGVVKCTLQSSSVLLESIYDISNTAIELFEAQVIEFY